MKKSYWMTLLVLVFSLIFCDPVQCAGLNAEEDGSKPISVDKRVVRTCVIGGMTLTGLWNRISKMFEAKTGYEIEVVSTGPRPKISKPFRRGEADLLTMHSGDITTDLVIEGYGVNMRPWTRNDLVILGPSSDPAGIKGMRDGAEALRRIAESKSNFLDGMGIGMREMSHKLWKKAGIKPIGSWVIKDESPENHDMLLYAEKRKAYMIFGRMPVVLRKVPAENMAIMVEGDPDMRRPYIVVEANPEVFSHANHTGARALSDFLLSEEVQNFLKNYGVKKNGGYPFFYPVWPYGS